MQFFHERSNVTAGKARCISIVSTAQHLLLNAKESTQWNTQNACFKANFLTKKNLCRGIPAMHEQDTDCLGNLCKHECLCSNPSLSLCSNVRISGGIWPAGSLTMCLTVEIYPRLQCQCVGMCWWGGEEGEGGRTGGCGLTAVAPLFLWSAQLCVETHKTAIWAHFNSVTASAANMPIDSQCHTLCTVYYPPLTQYLSVLLRCNFEAIILNVIIYHVCYFILLLQGTFYFPTFIFRP